MKVYGRHCLVDTDQVALYVERHYDDTYEVFFTRLTAIVGMAQFFQWFARAVPRDNGPHCKAEQNAEKVVVLPDE